MLKEIFKNTKKGVLINCIYSIILIPVGIILSMLYSRIIDMVTQYRIGRVIQYSVAIVALYIVIYATKRIVDIIFQKDNTRGRYRFRISFYGRCMNASRRVLEQSGTGVILENVTHDVDRIIDYVSKCIPAIITGLVSMAAYGVYLIANNAVIGIIMMCAGLVQVIVPMVISRYAADNYVEAEDEEAKITECIMSGYYGFADIKIMKLKKWYDSILADIHTRYTRVGKKQELMGAAEMSAQNLADSLLRYGTYAICAIVYMNGRCTMSQAVAAVAVSDIFYSAMNDIFSNIPDIKISREAVKRLSVIYNADRQQEYRIDIGDTDNNIVLITGENGSGKTTFLKRLIYDGSSNISGITVKEGNSNYYYMPQRDVAPDMSIDNIMDMTSGIDRERFNDILTRFEICNTVKDTDMSNLSGGELKKINIALAFASDKEVLILDEPTNNLDVAGISVLKELIVKSGRKIIMVSHDRQITEFADIVEYNVAKITEECAS